MHRVSTFVNNCGSIPYVGTDTEDGRDGRQTIKGPQRERVAVNVKELRGLRRMTLAELSVRLHLLGHPLRSTAIHKIEQRERKVDADDLVALALALDVSPNRLLLPGTAVRGVDTQLTNAASVDELDAWRWARGKQTFFGLPMRQEERQAMQYGRQMYERRVEFPRINRPDVPEHPPTAQVGPHWRELQNLWQATSSLAAEIGCSLEAVLRLIPDAEIVTAAPLRPAGWRPGVGDPPGSDGGRPEGDSDGR